MNKLKTNIFLLVIALMFIMTGNGMPLRIHRAEAACDSINVSDSISMPDSTRVAESIAVADSFSLADSVIAADSITEIPDTTVLDSTDLDVYRHNKAVDDSLHMDSLNRQRSGGVNSPIAYQAKDSLVYNAATKRVYLYGSSNVKYENMDLTSDRINVSLDSSLVHATGSKGQEKEIIGTPVFKMGSDTYESDTIAFNFKSKRGFINNVFTEQQDGFLRSERSKRDSLGNLYLEHGRYTTCDKEHPDFYIALSRAKVRPGKDVVFGPAYLVVADVPLPLAVPYGFFPFSKKYSSGFIMPSYGDEQRRGFYLRNGGYYFAINDKIDLKLLGEIYTKGSWGISAASNYNKRYKYNGSFYLNYQDTKDGEKGLPDYSRTQSFKIQWTHHQDPKANPYNTVSASVNFATSSFERNNLTSMYNPQSLTQSTRTSSVNWSTTFSSIGMTINSTANLSQNMNDSSIAVTLPDVNISIARFYPFKRKKMAGKERWYEKISLSYTGQLSNSIQTKEDMIAHSDLIKDWRNGMKHNIPISGNFMLFNYLNINPSFNFTDRMYTNKVTRSWDNARQTEVCDTTYGFHNVYDWSFQIAASTKLYGFYIPSKKIFGEKIQAVRHVITPKISYSYAPDFGSERYGYYSSYQKTDRDGNVSLVEYSPYQNSLFGVPGRGKSGNISWDLSNNIEMKVKSDKDSTGVKKLSIIDELGFAMSYNTAAKERPLSDLDMRIRLKWWKNYTFNMNARFASYAYELDENGHPYVGNHTEWGMGRFGRFLGMSQNFSFTLTPEKLKKLFSGGDDDDDDKRKNKDYDDYDEMDTDIESNVDDVMVKGQSGAKRGRSSKAKTDDDGYMHYTMPWSLTVGYGITMREDTQGKFNTKSMRYPYKFSQNLNFSGNISLSEGWNISFSSGFDFDTHKISMTTANIERDLHCFNMSCSVVLAPYTSYNFSFRCNASTLADALKYDKRSGYTNAVEWY